MNLSQPYYIDPRQGQAHLDLNGTWDLAHVPAVTAPEKIDYPLQVTVPGSVFWQLYEAGVMPNPYEGVNSREFAWVDDEVWYYRRRFTLPAVPDGQAFLCFDGACYFTRVFLNGTLLGEHEGMFGGPVCEVSALLREGSNELVAEVKACNWHNPRFTSRNQDQSVPMPIVPWNLMREKDTLPGDFNVIGLWGSVRIEFVNPTHLSRPYLITQAVAADGAHLHFEVEISDPAVNELGAPISDSAPGWTVFTFSFHSGNPGRKQNREMAVLLELTEHETGNTVYSVSEPYRPYDWEKSFVDKKYWECHHYQRDIVIKNPRLWMPAALGKPDLYDVRVVLTQDGEILDTLTFQTGIRVIGREYSAGDKFRARWDRFSFVINGKNVFLTGVNWMPIDHFLILREEEYRWSLERARDMGVMIIRIWSGGGIPESDTFYRLCDELGLMVWQDHMIANIDTPNWDMDVLLNQECMNLYRIRNHPSLAVHCGGNEFNPYSKGNLSAMSVISNAVEDLDPCREYVRTTPDRGSAHIYMDMEPTWYRTLSRQLPFVAESGIHSFPSMKALRQMISPEERARPLANLFSPDFERDNPELRNHFVEYVPERIPRMLSRASAMMNIDGISLEDLAEATQVASFEFYQVMIEALRENWPVTCGVMPWVYRRPSVAVGIQLMDGIGQPIAPYWAVRKAYRPLNVSLMLPDLTWAPGENMPLQVCVINGRGEALSRLQVRVDIYDPDLKGCLTRETYLALAADESHQKLDLGEFVIPREFGDRFFFATVTLSNAGGELVRKVYWPRCLSLMADEALRHERRARPSPNLMITKGPWLKPQVSRCGCAALEARLKARGEDELYCTFTLEIINRGTKPAFPVTVDSLSGPFTADDNYFFLLPGEARQIHATLMKKGLTEDNCLVIKAWNSPETVIGL